MIIIILAVNLSQKNQVLEPANNLAEEGEGEEEAEVIAGTNPDPAIAETGNDLATLILGEETAEELNTLAEDTRDAMEDAERKATEAKIRAVLSQMRAEAELYNLDVPSSYAGFCASLAYTELIQDIPAIYSTQCEDSPTYWIAVSAGMTWMSSV